LILKYEKLFSNCAFNCKLRHYTGAALDSKMTELDMQKHTAAAAAARRKVASMVGCCRLNPVGAG